MWFPPVYLLGALVFQQIANWVLPRWLGANRISYANSLLVLLLAYTVRVTLGPERQGGVEQAEYNIAIAVFALLIGWGLAWLVHLIAT